MTGNIQNYYIIAAPLTDVLIGKTKKGEITWTAQCNEAFRVLKKKLTDKKCLHTLNFKNKFLLQTDASNTGMGIVLSQEDNTSRTGEHPILYLGKTFSEVKKA